LPLHPLLRRSLRISAVEGVLAEVVGSCATGGVLTAWSIYLGLGPVLLGLLGALPFAAQLLQLPAAMLSRRAGPRRTALAAVAVSRETMLPLAILPFLGLSPMVKEVVLLCCAGASAILGVVANSSWTRWMAELVPRPLHGRYFARRNVLCAISSVAGSFAAGVALDGGVNAAAAGVVLTALALTASAAGLCTVLLLRLQHEPALDAETAAPTLQEALSPLRTDVARRALAFEVAWGTATGLAAAFYPLHIFGELRAGFARMAAFGSGVAALRTFAAPIWASLLKRAGPRRIVVACAVGLTLSPALWMFAGWGFLWMLALDAALCGVLMAGYGVMVGALPVGGPSGTPGRAYFLATVASAGGLATGLASTCGAAIAHLLTTRGGLVVAMHLLFLLGALGRILAAVLGLRMVEHAAT
jgi:MFS transporter